MTHIDNVARRPYRSDLRARQADSTRERILDATVRVMAAGIASISIPDVAREAGVSIPTVYRHFGTKAELLAAVYPHLARRAGIAEVTAPGSIGEFRDLVRSLFDRLGSLDDLARAAMASPAASEARRITMPDRLALGRRSIEAIAPDLDVEERDRIARLMVIVTASASLRLWRDQFDASSEEVGDDVEWILRALIAAARRDRR